MAEATTIARSLYPFLSRKARTSSSEWIVLSEFFIFGGGGSKSNVTSSGSSCSTDIWSELIKAKNSSSHILLFQNKWDFCPLYGVVGCLLRSGYKVLLVSVAFIACVQKH